ncbi:MAG: COX15/CtaA family protein [Alphaproteobacteria bacterium]
MPVSPRLVAHWLLLCCGMIFMMAVIGAITRLTESGLSIVEWAPVTGAIPPLNDADWQKAFAGYQQIPQYQLLHSDMTLEDFKHIYFWEWLHRFWGRLIGLVYAVPFFWFLARRQIPAGYHGKLWLGLALGGLQGAVGWFMVASGLSTRIYVSHYRLALHLALALVIYGYLLWLALNLLLRNPNAGTSRAARNHGWICLGLLTLTIIWGALVAGLKAGWVYNSFPLMDGALLPDAAWTLQPFWLNFFDNTALVQFCHRWLGLTTAAVIWLWCWRLLRQSPARSERRVLIALILMVALQALLGIVTLLSQVNIVLATLHQAGALVTLTLLLVSLHRHQTPLMLNRPAPEG